MTGVILMSLALAAPACAGSDKDLAINDPGLKGAGKLAVTSPAFPDGGTIPDRYSSYGQSVSPPLAWTGQPQGTRGYALVVQDPDAPTPKPFIHWMIWNVPAGATKLEEGKVPEGSAQGKLMFVGTVGYMGPKPPAGPAHHYHVQLFALDQPLALADGGDYGALTAAMKGHVLASGELVGLYQKH